MRHIIALFIAAAAMLTVPAGSSAAPHCAEDAPCFNWAHDGNHRRGVTLNTPNGEPTRRAVVSVCQFNLYDRAGWIDWQRTPRLRGDGFARSLTDCRWRLRFPTLDAAFPVL